MLFFFFQQKTAYELLISYWISDLCSSDLRGRRAASARHRRSLRAATMISYLARIQAAVANGAIPADPGGVTHVDVEHAKGCHADHGRRCICTPRITVIVGGEALTIAREGETSNRRAMA